MSKLKKRVALIIPSLQPGGMERVMSVLATSFSSKKGVEVHLILYGKKPTIFYDIKENIIVHIVSPGKLDRFPILHPIKKIFFIRKTIKRIDPSSVLSFGTQWNNFVLLALLFTKYPVFVSDRGSPARTYKWSTELLRRYLYKRAEGIIVQTEIAKDLLRNKYDEEKIFVIGNPIRQIHAQQKVIKDNIILSVGRLIASKHHDRLITIFSKLRAPNWKLIIIGGDALKEKNYVRLNKMVEDLDITDRVELQGEQRNIDEYYKRSKIFAFTSSVEGFPNVVGEALSAGLPVVSYDCISGPSEMINDGENGFLISVFDDNEFQDKLQLLIDNESLRQGMAEKAPESISQYSVETIAQQYTDIILQ